jgi:translation initiation factor IF-1
MSRNNNDTGQEIVGTIVEALPNTLFRVLIENGSVVLAYMAGRMRMYRIRVLVGDKVLVKLDDYGGKARIVKRL